MVKIKEFIYISIGKVYSIYGYNKLELHTVPLCLFLFGSNCFSDAEVIKIFDNS